MARTPAFLTLGRKTGTINVELSYKIIALFSEGLYASPNKAIEELVANAFDAGAQKVHVLLSPNLSEQDATIVVADDGEGMDESGLRQHWRIGSSSKRDEGLRLPRGRQQIGRFGIGKLATYVLASRLTHVTKRRGKYYLTSMDYSAITKSPRGEVTPAQPIKLPLRELTVGDAKKFLKPWIESQAFEAGGLRLFGKGAPASWTVALLSSLRPKADDIQPSMLEWVLRTGMPLRDDFKAWLDGREIVPKKIERPLIAYRVIAKDKPLDVLDRPAPKKHIVRDENISLKLDDIQRFGFVVPLLGRITGYAEVYEDLLTQGKSAALGRSHGFFVYVRGRLVNVMDGHFGIPADELRHGSFGRFRCVVNMDSLDGELRSTREAISEGPAAETARDVLRAIFNAMRPLIEEHDAGIDPLAQLVKSLSSSPASLSRLPIVRLAREVAERNASARYLTVPRFDSPAARESFFAGLTSRAADNEQFVTSLGVDYSGSVEDGIVRFETESGALRINAWHPFVATFHDQFVATRSRQPLELIVMAEVLLEAHLHALGVPVKEARALLDIRDDLFRDMADEAGPQSALAVASRLRDARNSSSGLEESLCAAFKKIGFDVTPLGQSNLPDGVASAVVGADEDGSVQAYKVSLEAKSKTRDGLAVGVEDSRISTVARHRNQAGCDHAVIVGSSFAAGELLTEIQSDRELTSAAGAPKTITLITIDALAKLVRLVSPKGIGLRRLRELFRLMRHEETTAWVDAIASETAPRPPYREILEAIDELQRTHPSEALRYQSILTLMRVRRCAPSITSSAQVSEHCRSIAQIAPRMFYAKPDQVYLDQSVGNVLEAIDKVLDAYPVEENAALPRHSGVKK